MNRQAVSPLGVALLLGCAAWGAQAAQPALPDLAGVWENLSGIHLDRFSMQENADPGAKAAFKAASPPYNADYAARYKAVRDAAAQGRPLNDPTASCVWPGVPRVIWNPYPLEIVVAAGGRRVMMIHEYMSQVRRVYADGRGHPDDLETSYNGHTTGRWDNQTLVMDTVGLREDTMLQNTGMPHSAELRVQERWRLIGADLLEAEITLHDPLAFTAPYVTTRRYRRHRDWEISDYVCEENNRERIVNGVTRQQLPQAK